MHMQPLGNIITQSTFNRHVDNTIKEVKQAIRNSDYIEYDVEDENFIKSQQEMLLYYEQNKCDRAASKEPTPEEIGRIVTEQIEGNQVRYLVKYNDINIEAIKDNISSQFNLDENYQTKEIIENRMDYLEIQQDTEIRRIDVNSYFEQEHNNVDADELDPTEKQTKHFKLEAEKNRYLQRIDAEKDRDIQRIDAEKNRYLQRIDVESYFEQRHIDVDNNSEVEDKRTEHSKLDVEQTRHLRRIDVNCHFEQEHNNVDADELDPTEKRTEHSKLDVEQTRHLRRIDAEKDRGLQCIEIESHFEQRHIDVDNNSELDPTEKRTEHPKLDVEQNTEIRRIEIDIEKRFRRIEEERINELKRIDSDLYSEQQMHSGQRTPISVSS